MQTVLIADGLEHLKQLHLCLSIQEKHIAVCNKLVSPS